jgi:hypothetical protein
MDNAGCHHSNETSDHLKEFNFLPAPHRLFSSDLAPSDFYLFEVIKEKTVGSEFGSAEELAREVTDITNFMPHVISAHAFREQGRRLLKCIDIEIDCVDGDMYKTVSAVASLGLSMLMPSRFRPADSMAFCRQERIVKVGPPATPAVSVQCDTCGPHAPDLRHPVPTFLLGGDISVRLPGGRLVERLPDLFHCDERAIVKWDLGEKNVAHSYRLLDAGLVDCPRAGLPRSQDLKVRLRL